MNDAREMSLPMPARYGPVVFAFIGTQALGDFVMQHLTAASVSRSFTGGRLVVIYRDDRPYKSFCNDINPYVTKTVRIPDDPGAMSPIDDFSGLEATTHDLFTEEEKEQGLHRPDVFLTPSMLDIGRLILPPPRLRVPGSHVPELAERLAERGLRRDRWFSCLHVREGNYQWRRGMDATRTNDPQHYLPMITRIITEQGGQVVRLGDPSMTPIPAMDGLIDLAAQDAPFEEQAFAVSRARFFVGTDSGPTQLACAFQTPMATTNAILATVWNDGDIVLLKKYRLPNGRIVERDELVEIGAALRHGMRPKGTTLIDNTPEELASVADRLYDITADCPGWRDDDAGEDGEGNNKIRLPLIHRGFDEMAALEVWT